MKYYDQHVHSYYSFDSEQPIEEYLDKATELGITQFVLTDHFDLNYVSTGKDLDFDIAKQHEELALLSKKYPNIQILKGIEIGYVKTEMPRIDEIMRNHKFDIVNFSVHEDGKLDYYYVDQYLKCGVAKALDIYFNNVLEALDSGFNFDVLCHFDYGFKTAYLIDNSFKLSNYENYVIKILKKVIELDKVLEINVKVQECINNEHTKYILNLYKKLGGKNITLSSDAHDIGKFYDKFDHYLKLIKDAGFDHLNYFINRQRFDFKI